MARNVKVQWNNVTYVRLWNICYGNKNYSYAHVYFPDYTITRNVVFS